MFWALASITSLFDRAIIDTGRLAAFLFFIALLGTFAFIRTSTHMIRAQVKWWPGNVDVGGTHVHHLVFGIIGLLVFGYIGVVLQPPSPWHEIIAVLLGIASGLTLDEFALWLELKDVYWEKDGRKSVDAMIVAGSLAGIVLVGFTAWVELAEDVEEGVITAIGLFGALGIAVAAVNAAKEKFGMALLALVFWPAAAVSALRLARPRSVWSRAFYRGHQLERSRARYPAAAGAGGVAEPSSPAAESGSDTAGQSSS